MPSLEPIRKVGARDKCLMQSKLTLNFLAWFEIYWRDCYKKPLNGILL